MPQDERLDHLRRWLDRHLGAVQSLQPASGDASFRRYFRVTDADGRGFIAMDAPPEREPLHPFLDVGRRLADAGVHVPRVYLRDTAQGFALLDDFGSAHYLGELSPDTADALYGDAFDALVHIQQADPTGLPDYDRPTLEREMALFPEWFLGYHLGLKIHPTLAAALSNVAMALTGNALDQPQVFVHRDYHSRNLMRTTHNNPGVLDFQDALRGALTYDPVSLLRDAYVAWPEERVHGWALSYRDRAAGAGLCEPVDDVTFLRWFDLMGLQRHLKVLGIFARLYHRDGKAGYLRDLPRVLAYVMHVAPRHPETAPLAELISTLDIPARLEATLSACAP